MFIRQQTNQRSLFSRLVSAFLILLLFISFSLPEAMASSGNTGTTTAKVVLRKSADKDSKALQTIPEGEEVDLLGTSGSWYKVRYGNFSGYVMKKYVKASKTSTVANEEHPIFTMLLPIKMVDNILSY